MNQPSKKSSKLSRWPIHVTALLSMLLLCSCTLLNLQKEADEVNHNVVIHGELIPQAWQGEPIVIVLSREADSTGRHAVDYRVQHRPGPFYFFTEPGNYQLAAFEDRSGELRYRPGDPALVSGDIAASVAQARVEADLTGELSSATQIPARFDISSDSQTTTVSAGYRNLGRIVTMDAPEMSLELGQDGLWKPAEHREKLEIGLFFLEPFDPAKTPVVFVHGIGGAPVQFEKIAADLDRERYQPWFFAYPSIYPLQMVADTLNVSMDIVRRRYDFERVHLVAHSMGGPVSRAYLNEYSWSEHDYTVNAFITVASPLGGHASASMYPSEDQGASGPMASWIAEIEATEEGGMQHVAWTDMSPDSAFMSNLFSKPLPESVEYHLIFTFLGDARSGPPNDGTVSLISQLRADAQREAITMRGYSLGHTAVLAEEDVSTHLQTLLVATDE